MTRLRNELHHWWPRSLSKYWADTDGHASAVFSDGTIVRSKPRQFGAIRNAHNIKMAPEPTVWDISYEQRLRPLTAIFLR